MAGCSLGYKALVQMRYRALASAVLALTVTLPTSRGQLEAQQQLPELLPQRESSQNMTSRVAFGGGGKWLAEGKFQGPVRIFDLQSGRVSRTFACGTFAAHPTEDVLACLTRENVIVTFDVATGEERWRVQLLSASSFLPDGNAVLEFGSDGRDLLFSGMPESLPTFGFSAKAALGSALRRGRLTNSRETSREVLIGRWSIANGRELERRKAKGGPAFYNSPAETQRLKRLETPDGSKRLVVVPFDGWSIFDTRRNTVAYSSPTDTPAMTYDWALSPDGLRVATVVRDALVVAELGDVVRYRQPAATSADNLVTTGDVATLRQEASDTRAPVFSDPRLREYASIPARPSGAFTRDNRWFVARAPDGQIDVWDTATGNHLPFRLAGPPLDSAGTAGLSPIAVRSLPGASDGAEGWRPVAIESAPWLTKAATEAGDTVCRSRDGRYTVELGAADGYITALVRDVDGGRTLAELTGIGGDPVAGCMLSDDGSRVVMAGDGRPVRRKSTPTGGQRSGETSLVVIDVRRAQLLALLNDRRSQRPGRFPLVFVASTIHWSSDQRFIIGGGFELPGFISTGPLRAWHADTGEEIDLASVGLERARPLGFVPGSNDLAVIPAKQSTAEIWSLQPLIRKQAHVSRLPATDATTPLVSNARVIVTAGEALEIRRLGTGELLGDLTVFRGGDWLVSTPAGFFDGSPGGWQRLAWRTTNGVTAAPGELFFNEFYRPGLLATLLEGRMPNAEIQIDSIDRRQPRVTLTARRETTSTARVTLAVGEELGVGGTRGSGARDLRLFRNGLLVKAWRNDLPLADGTFNAEVDVPLVGGTNRFTAYAFNHDNVKSLDASGTLDGGTVPSAATVHILAIGIDHYANADFDLAFASADARAFASDVAARQRERDPAAAVRVIPLLDADATRGNILAVLARLAGREGETLPATAPPFLRSLEPAAPEDTVIVFFAGHGIASGDRFHLIPADIGYQGRRRDVGAALPDVLAHGISDLDLERAFEPLDVRHLALVIDACQSGQALGDDDQRFGPMNSRGLAQLAYEKGMSILAASQAYQAALESAQLGHGYLTYALISEGLRSAVADDTPRDGKITLEEWFTYAVRRVPQLQSDALTQAQQQGRTLRFDLGDQTPGDSRVQMPRLFTRRDANGDPLVIAAAPK